MTKHPIFFRLTLTLTVISCLAFSLFLWLQTPALFEHFNQAFCAH